MTSTEWLKKEIDTSGNEKLETQEMEEFLKSEENIKKLWEAMNSSSSPELLQELENTLKDLCDKILSQTEISENQQKILDYFLDKFWEKYPEIKEKATKLIDIRALEEDISMAVETLLNNPLTNLEDLWINTKKSQFNWKNLLNDIKTIEDVEKINESTITKYLKISPNIPQENYAYIANNVKTIIKRHLEVNPKYQSILWWQSSHMTIETTVKNNEYLVNLYSDVENFIKKSKNNETVQINNIVWKINKWDQYSLQFAHLRLNTYLWNKKEAEQNKIVEKIFDKFPSTNPENFLNACDKDNALWSLKARYIFYWIYKEDALLSLKDKNWKSIYLLDFSKKNKFIKFIWKWWKISEELNLDKIYQDSEKEYEKFKWMGISEKIPLQELLYFYSSIQETYNFKTKKVAELKKKCGENMGKYVWSQEYVNNAMLMWGTQARMAQHWENKAKVVEPIQKEIITKCVALEKEYAKLLLKSGKSSWKIPWISWCNFTLDFSKWNNPENIVRDSFNERLKDNLDEFVKNLSYDRKAAVWWAVWMIAWIAASWASCVSWNIWAAAWAFTLISRIANWATQEQLNTMQRVVESISWEKATWWNQVNDLWDSFMKWIWAYEPVVDGNWQPILDKSWKIQYQFIWWERFASNLAFDYLWWVAMFWAFKALWPSFEAIKSVKIAWRPLEFAAKWLFVQNFWIDMPMNALHKWTDVFLWIWDPQQKYHWSFLYWHNNWWQEIEWEDTEWNEYYKSWNIWDAFEAMLGNMEEHMSLNNQSQVLFNTLLYCGMLEAWQWLASKMKPYMPVARIEKYETSSRKFQEAQRNFVSEISKKWLKLNEKFELVNAKTWKKIGALEFLEFKLPLLKLKWVLAEHRKATQELIASEKELSGDWSKTYGLLKEMWLLSDKQPPLNILKEKIIEAKKQYQKAIEAWDIRKAQDLKEIILDHQSAQIVLISEFHPDAINNIKLSSEKRIEKAKELLQSELTAEQEQAILDAHNAPWDAYSLSIPELRAKSKILFKAWFTEAQVRTLIENCICGKMKWVKIEEWKWNEETKENTNENKTNVERLEELWIEVNPMNIDEINSMEIDLKKVEKLKNIWIKFNELFQYKIEEISKIEIDYEKLEYMINLWMEIRINQVKELNDRNIDKETLLRMKNIWILNCFRREKINESNIEVFEKLKNVWVEITYDDGNPLLNLIYQFEFLWLKDADFQFIKENHLTNYQEIWFALSLKDNMNKETIQEYIKRKQEYLKNNRLISKEKYRELFWWNWKYWKTDINQTFIWICYAYSWFEILKKTNCFDELIQTNLKENLDGTWWEVRVPFCDNNWEWIKINKDEIDFKFERKYENWEKNIVSINSESEFLWFKILELAFIKKYILNAKKWSSASRCTRKGIDYKVVEEAQSEYKNTGKITYNDDLVKFIESWSTLEFIEEMFNPKWNSYFISWTENHRLGVSNQSKDVAFENFNKWGVFIEISMSHDNINDFPENTLNKNCKLIWEGEDYRVLVHDVKIIDKAQYNLESLYNITSDWLKEIEINGSWENNKMVPDLVTDENWKTICQFFNSHSYSIEKCYIDKNTWEKRVWVINPRHTGLKFDISLEEAKSIFSWNIFWADINAMFR